MSITDPAETPEPDWATPLEISLTADEAIHALFTTAESVHTGWESCIDSKFVIHEINAVHDNGESHCRFVEQEYIEEELPDVTWHDWVVELKLADIYLTAHWRTAKNDNPADWEWCLREAQDAFRVCCIFIGKKVRNAVYVEPTIRSQQGARTHH